jgi:hypothetical protein
LHQLLHTKENRPAYDFTAINMMKRQKTLGFGTFGQERGRETTNYTRETVQMIPEEVDFWQRQNKLPPYSENSKQIFSRAWVGGGGGQRRLEMCIRN